MPEESQDEGDTRLLADKKDMEKKVDNKVFIK